VSRVPSEQLCQAHERCYTARHRKRLLLLFAFIGAISAMVFFVLPSSSPIWPVSSLLAIISNVCFGASMVPLNAYLPSLARNSEEVAKAAAALANVPESTTLSEETDESENAGLLSSGTPVLADAKAEYSKALATATSRISSKGIATGYLAGIILLIVALIPVTKLNGSTLSLRLAIGMSGVWWGFFSLPAIVWLPSGSGGSEVPEKRAVWREMLVSWKRLGGMLRWEEIKKLRNTFKYLAAWFLLSDGSPFLDTPSRVSTHLTLLRLHHNHFDGGSFLQDSSIHASFFPHPHRGHRTYLWYHRFTRMAVLSTSSRPQ
jgi:UMF1 family MFS transporter